MGQPVVHFEIIGNDPAGLRDYYGDLFGWAFDTSGSVAESVSQQGNYGFTDPTANSDAPGIPGGVDGGVGYEPHVVFYVGVPAVEAALHKAEAWEGSAPWAPSKRQDETSSLPTSPTPRATWSASQARHSATHNLSVPLATVGSHRT